MSTMLKLLCGILSAIVVSRDVAVSSALPTCPTQPRIGLGLGGNFFKKTNATTWQECCADCAAIQACVSWTLHEPGTMENLTCGLRNVPSPQKNTTDKTKTSGIMPPPPPSPPPPTPPPPPPVPAGSQKNIVFVLTDDQDLVLGSMQALPNIKRLIGDAGANMTQFRVNTPICCPSRSTMLSGRYEHNNRVKDPTVTGCMRQNTSRATNPGFWENSVVMHLHNAGYTTGMFGKVLNVMDTYGCKSSSGMPPGLDRSLIMCTHTFFDCDWVNDTVLVHTGNNPEDYTTSVMGNASVAWIRSVLEMGKTHPPFYAWIGPHAPHLPAIPAPWYVNHPIGKNTAPRTEPWYNYSGLDHHPIVARQPILSEKDAAGIDIEYSKRLISLLSVDDLMVGVYDVLMEFNEWENTYVFFSSDHGYSLGQFRLPSHKMQVYDNNLRVPFLVKGPGISPGTFHDNIAGFVDLQATMLTLAGIDVPANNWMDGRSFAHLLVQNITPPARPWKHAHIAEYQSISNTHCEHNCGHQEDGPTNTYRSMRIINDTHNLLYAEFTDVTIAADWSFPVGGILFREYYDLNTDPYELHNHYNNAPSSLKEALHAQLDQLFHCVGSDCP
eukprot:m.39508 g.39508  ORF g.39508 m.39508 type:complete len:609 (-) comp14720_c0_seq1:149-1975(-)